MIANIWKLPPEVTPEETVLCVRRCLFDDGIPIEIFAGLLEDSFDMPVGEDDVAGAVGDTEAVIGL